MNTTIRLVALSILTVTLASFARHHSHKSFPYKKAGLTDLEASTHLLNRFSFGPRPGQAEELVRMGLEKWFDLQLQADLPEDSLQMMLNSYQSLTMSNTEIANTYPRPGKLLKLAIQENAIVMDSVGGGPKNYKDQLQTFMDANGYRPQAELARQLINQKILRAVFARNQLQEVLTDFWFNHFNVSMTKGESKDFITAYERDVIRPNALANFRDLLIATAKSPAMLTYLDNFRSVGTDSLKRAKGSQGLNENYAREIMELHTLGVDGGYTQADVTNAAKILTGWTIYPMDTSGENRLSLTLKKLGAERMLQMGFVHEQDFLFAATRHNKDDKTVLNIQFPSGSGYDEGIKLLDLLAGHPSTAAFISKKLATHFVSDDPSQSLVSKMTRTFLETKGNIKEVLLTMVRSPEFWDKKTIRAKTKSPFELAVSSVRSLNAEVNSPYRLNDWITKMGQQIYYCQAPTGFPDNGRKWINTGSLINRMNFELALTSKKIPGVVTRDPMAVNEVLSPEFQYK